MVFSNDLLILVEGNDDKQFILGKVRGKIEFSLGVRVCPREYSQRPDELVKKWISDFKGIRDQVYFLSDKDEKHVCIIEMKKEIDEKYIDLKYNNIVLVITKIEGWYLAGFPKFTKTTTDDINKKSFKEAIFKMNLDPDTAKDEMIRDFNISLAKQRNASFKYFCAKMGI